MKKLVLPTLLLAAAIAVAWIVRVGPNGSVAPESDLRHHSTLADIPQVRTEPREPIQFEVDRDRLYDASYQSDPDLIAYANSVDRTPECVLTALRTNDTPQQSKDPACYSVSQEAHKIGYTVSGLSEMTDEQLLTLAQTDPNANLLLVYRHLQDPQLVAEHVERAMALSGKAGPVQLLQATDDVPDRVHGLEVLLTSEALGRRIDPLILEEFRSGMTDEMQALAARRAQERVTRIVRLHKELTGKSWRTS